MSLKTIAPCLPLNTIPGTLIVFTGENGYEQERKRAFETFPVGVPMRLHSINIGATTSYLTVADATCFYNSVMFCTLKQWDDFHAAPQSIDAPLTLDGNPPPAEVDAPRTPITDRDMSVIALIQRSPRLAYGWRQVSDTVWPLVSNPDAPELFELNHDDKMIRLSERGMIVAQYLPRGAHLSSRRPVTSKELTMGSNLGLKDGLGVGDYRG